MLAVVSATMIILVGSPSLAAETTAPLVIAHATGKRDAPENTTQGIAIAASKGADWVEIDVRFNKSNFPFAMHNPDVDTTTDGTGLLNNFWFQDVFDLDSAMYDKWDDKKADGSWTYPQYHGTYLSSDGDYKAKVHPPYAWEFFNAANTAGVSLILDLKEVPTQTQADLLLSYADRFAYRSKVIVQTSIAAMQAMKSFGYTDLTYYLIENPTAGMMRTGESLKSVGASGYTLYWTNITPALVKYYHSYGLKVFTWTTNSASDDVASSWTKVADAGVDGVITDQHDVARNLL